MVAKDETSMAVLEAVHSVWEEWSQRAQLFANEPKEMHPAFRKRLAELLPDEYHVPDKEAYPFAGRGSRFSPWRAYDVAVRWNSRLIALLELSMDDTTVCHALHNGENKLLGMCEGTGVKSGRAFWENRGLTPADMAFVQMQLASIPIRGLFFISRLSQHSLDVPQRAIWTDGASRPFRSALMSSEQTTLREVFQRLADAGLYVWFYSLRGEESLEYLRAEGV